MDSPDPDVFRASPGDVIQITVQSVNMVQNAKFDPKLTVTSDEPVRKVGQITMGNTETTFAVAYSFPKQQPAGAKYTRTVTGPGNFTDGPFDVTAAPGEELIMLPYILKPAQAGGVGGGGQG